eukprot:TRINITY_DN3926_c0_g2_i1.p2 TRINITY_DN3926_c0_g2~~TRINITY_DN3926_c0_g2_i1.p2  ORF type:complete len:408 (-),score=128.52 TRINITY_DN3926_c0_g2_i1:145-1368(-)
MRSQQGVLLALLFSLTNAEVYFLEKFENKDWSSKWVKSTWKEDEDAAGEFKWTAGKWYGDEKADKGVQTHPDSRFYAMSAAFPEFSNEGKDLVVQLSVKHEQKLDCGGGYIKLVPASSSDQMAAFSGDTPYSIMFGPDICGYSTKKVHVIFTYKEKNYLTKKDIKCETDQLTHVYSLVLHSNNTYKVFVDLEQKEEGSLYEDFDMLPPRQIKDPEASKPEDWDERAKIPDPEDKKPEGWDDIPEMISDPKAVKPEDWDDEADGEWEAPQIKNPEFKGEWKPKMIENPDYKGKWEAPLIDNPDFEDDPSLYLFPSTKFVAFELWQVKAGTIFDNIVVTDDWEYAKQLAEDTWGKSKDAEKEMFEKAEEERKAEEAAEKAAASKASEDTDDEYDDADEDEETVDMKEEL